MTKQEEAKLEMLDATAGILERGNGIISDLPVLVQKTKLIREMVEKIRSKEEEFTSVVAGKTSAKNLTKRKIREMAQVAASGLYSYGLDNNDMEAAARGDFNESAFSKMREEAVITTVKNVLTKAEELGNVLEEYGVSSKLVEDLKQGVDEYYQRLGQKSTGFATKKSARSTRIDLFNLVDSEIKKTDRLMKRYENLAPEFYGNYMAARVIKDKAVTKRNTELKH